MRYIYSDLVTLASISHSCQFLSVLDQITLKNVQYSTLFLPIKTSGLFKFGIDVYAFLVSFGQGETKKYSFVRVNELI